jgi:hypothetical protein
MKISVEPILTTMGVAEAPLPSEVHVTIDVAKDVVTDVGMNNQGAQTSPTIVIAAVVKDIVQGDSNKSTDGNATVDPAEPEPEEEPMQPMEDIDEGGVGTEGVMDALEHIAILEQVT